jgi:hypothetical protein
MVFREDLMNRRLEQDFVIFHLLKFKVGTIRTAKQSLLPETGNLSSLVGSLGLILPFAMSKVVSRGLISLLMSSQSWLLIALNQGC